jgi:hypothetical protein
LEIQRRAAAKKRQKAAQSAAIAAWSPRDRRAQWESQLNLSGEKANLQVTDAARGHHVVSCHYWPLYFMRKFLFNLSKRPEHIKKAKEPFVACNYFLRRSLCGENKSASRSGAIKLE